MLPSSDSLQGKVALVTGANTGIGLVTGRELCRGGARVFMACRSTVSGEAAVQSIKAAIPHAKVELLSLDLGDLDSVRRCAASFLAKGLPLHVLVNNAGLAGGKGMTTSGFELAFGTNHIGHFLLVQLLLDRLKASAPARIVTVASRAHYRVPAWDWDTLEKPTKSLTGLDEYGVSKLANVLFSAELAKRLQGTGVTTYSLHPGVVASDVWRSVPWPIRPLIKRWMITVEEGALTTLHCATSSEVTHESGLYYDKCKSKLPSVLGRDAQLAESLWKRSEAWVQPA